MGQSRRRAARSRAASFVVIALAAVLSLPTIALAASASFSGKAPSAASSIASVAPKIAVTGYAAYGVKGSGSYSLEIDGVKTTTRIAYATRGDYRRFTISGASPALSAGSHTAAVTVRDRRGHSSKVKWSFKVRATPQSVSPLLVAPSVVALPAAASDVQPSYVGTATIHLYPVAGGHAFYRLDGGPVIAGDTVVVPPPVAGMATHSLYFLLADAAGNAGTPLTAVFTVSAPVPPADTVAPVTAVDSSGSQGPGGDFSLIATDNRPGPIATYWRIGDGEAEEGTAVHLPTPHQWGVGSVVWTVEYWSVDAAGNEELPHNTKTVTIDFDRPACTGDGCHSADVVTAHPCYTCHQAGVTATFDCETCHPDEEQSPSHDFLPPDSSCDAVAAYSGDARILVWAMDRSNGPIAQVLGAGVAFTCWRLDDGPVNQAAVPLGSGVTVVVAAPADGAVEHTLEYWSVDTRGNVEWMHKTAEFVVGAPMDPPFSDVRPSYVGTATIHISIPGAARIFYRLDSGAATAGDTVVVAPPRAGSAVHSLSFWGVDAVGNTGAPSAATFMVSAPQVDFTPPVTTCEAARFYSGPASLLLVASDGPDGSGVAHTFWRLDGGAWFEGLVPPVTAPGQHSLEFYSVDAAGNAEVRRTVMFLIDVNAPITRVSHMTVYNGPVDFYFSPIDDLGGSGVAETFWRLDAGSWVSRSIQPGPPLVSVPGPHTLEFYSVDNAGNTEGVNAFGFTILADTTPPITIPTPPPSSIGTVTIILNPGDGDGWGVAATYWQLDGGVTHVGTTVVVAPPVSGAANHALFYWSVDRAGNVETRKSLTFQVTAVPTPFTFDRVGPSDGSTVTVAAPTVRVAAHGGSRTITGATATLDGRAVTPVVEYYRFIALLPGNGGDGSVTSVSPDTIVVAIYYTVGTDRTQAYVTVPATNLANGMHTASVTVLGNDGTPQTKTWTFKVAIPDRTAPVTISDARTTYYGSATVRLSATDNVGGSGVAGTYWRLDGGAWSTGPVPPITAPGRHTLDFYSVDAAGNAETIKSAVFTVLLDTTPPATVSDALPSYAGSASIHLTALDNEGGSGVVATYWRLDSGPWTTGPIPPVTAPGTHVLQFYSVDAAGNAEQPKTVMFAVS